MAQYDENRGSYALSVIVNGHGASAIHLARGWTNTAHTVKPDPTVTTAFRGVLRQLLKRGHIVRAEHGFYIATDAGRIANSPGENRRLTDALTSAGLIPHAKETP